MRTAQLNSATENILYLSANVVTDFVAVVAAGAVVVIVIVILVSVVVVVVVVTTIIDHRFDEHVPMHTDSYHSIHT